MSVMWELYYVSGLGLAVILCEWCGCGRYTL